MASGYLKFILGTSTLIFKNRNILVLRDIKPNKQFIQILNENDHDGSLKNHKKESPRLDVSTNYIGASDTSSNFKLLKNSNCNILLMGSSTIQASALPKKNRIETIVSKNTNCNVVNIASVGESLEGSLLKYLSIKELEQFQFVFIMVGSIDAYLADNPNQKIFYEPVLGNIIIETFQRKVLNNNSFSQIFISKENKQINQNNKEMKNNKTFNRYLDIEFEKSIRRYKNILGSLNYATSSRDAELFLITTPYEPKNWVSVKDGSKNDSNNSLSIFNDMTRRISKKVGINLIDIDTIFNNSTNNYLYDSEHFNIEGAKVLSDLITKTINKSNP